MVKDADSRSYRVTHRTHYEYSNESSLCHNELHLKPRELPDQQVRKAFIEIQPTPACRFLWLDTFGNHVEFFSIEQVHSELTITSKSEVVRSRPVGTGSCGMTWLEVAQWVHFSRNIEAIAATEFLFDSLFCFQASEFEAYAKSKMDPSADAESAYKQLMHAIHSDFLYLPESTHVATSPLDVLAERRGVCQDFAHVLICCLRSLGIPARYVSGYLLTQPPPGEEKLVGADASHAWVSAFAGPAGWIDLDPTNDVVPGWEHLTVAWGRDYADVAPVQGVYVGGGFTSLHVAVDVMLANESATE
ncbi:MAG: transglutaminase family protein [Pirellula sp.]|nr:transglutaminase family protein [Pirellula sp.]